MPSLRGSEGPKEARMRMTRSPGAILPHFFSPLATPSEPWTLFLACNVLFQPGFQEPLGFSTSLFQLYFPSILHLLTAQAVAERNWTWPGTWFDFWFCCSRAVWPWAHYTFAGLVFSYVVWPSLTHRADTTVKSTKNVRVSQILVLATLMAMRGSPLSKEGLREAVVI